MLQTTGGSDHAGGGSGVSHTCTSRLQSMLAVSHKYQVSRLQMWCERELCERISVKEVCSILRQAYLLELKHLQEACLTFINGNLDAVVAMPMLQSMVTEWPELGVQIIAFKDCISKSKVSILEQMIAGLRQSRQGKEWQSEQSPGIGVADRPDCKEVLHPDSASPPFYERVETEDDGNPAPKPTASNGAQQDSKNASEHQVGVGLEVEGGAVATEGAEVDGATRVENGRHEPAISCQIESCDVEVLATFVHFPDGNFELSEVPSSQRCCSAPAALELHDGSDKEEGAKASHATE